MVKSGKGGAGYAGAVEQVVRAWHGWSRAERGRMDDVVEEVLHYARTGEGNAFVRGFWDRVLQPAIDNRPPRPGRSLKETSP